MSWLKNIQEKMMEDIIAQKTDVAYLDNAQRLSVYATGYYVRIMDVLATDFSMIHWVLGREKFRELAHEFVSHNPSHEYNINTWGNQLPGYLADHRISKEYPFISDLAKYEWNLSQSQLHARIDPVDFSQFQSLSMEKWIDARFVFQPNLILSASAWTFDKLHHAFAQQEPFSQALVEPTSTYSMFYQKEDGSYSSSIDEHEYKTLTLLMNGSSLGDVFETMDDENMVQAVFGWFQKWQEKELITHINFESHESE